jgi:uncharacterized membrane protein SirB2
MAEDSNKSPHILNTSSNLLGICFVVLTSLKVMKLNGETLIDEFTLVLMLLLTVSCIFSFLSIRSKNKQRSISFESIADYTFMAALGVLLVTTLLFTFGVIK